MSRSDDRREHLFRQQEEWMRQRAQEQRVAAIRSQFGAASSSPVSAPRALPEVDVSGQAFPGTLLWQTPSEIGDARAQTAHMCPVCGLPMLPASGTASPADRSPMLLVPCGHTACADCIKSQAGQNCPACGCRVDTQVVNRPLREAATLLAQHMEAASIAAPVVPSASAEDLEIRISIQLAAHAAAEAELVGARDGELVALDQEVSKLSAQEESLRAELRRLAAKHEDLEAQLANRRRDAATSAEEGEALEREVQHLQARARCFRRDREKCRLMVEYYGPPELLTTLVE